MKNSLYLVSSEEYNPGRSTPEIAAEAIKGGVDIIQMREKGKSMEELVLLGKELKELCSGSGVTFIVNDDPYLAKEVGADGVHLGQEDIINFPIEETRRILGEGKVVGISTHSVEQFDKANEMDFDYIAFGPIYHTLTKDYNIGTEDVERVLGIANKPIVFIGGINMSNIDGLLDKGARNIAVIRSIVQSDDITKAVRELKEKVLSYEDQDKR